jgi:beta-ureidopropionase / N-carbamoyl-L-amino-acid hydrolase
MNGYAQSFHDSYWRNQIQSAFSELRELSGDGIGVTRPSYGRGETLGLDFIAQLAAEGGLELERDAAANLVVTLPGRDPKLPAVVTGSHMDSVPQGGNYDGAAGIVAGLMCLLRMKTEGNIPLSPIRLYGLRGEESAWFGKAYIGSSALFGQLTLHDLERAHRDSALPLRHYLQELGADVARIAKGTPLVDPKSMAAYYELHIEQGPTMVARKVPVGVVTGIRGNIRHFRILCRGATGHSGAVPRWLRHDPVFALADLLVRLDEHWEKLQGQGVDLVITSGVVQTNAAEHTLTRIPGEIAFSLDIRSQSPQTLEEFYRLLHSECAIVRRNRGVEFEFDEKITTAPGEIAPELARELAGICDELQVPYIEIPSGAGHDAAVFAHHGVPCAMIFIRNEHGSHNPQESMELEDFILGTEVLYRALARKAGCASSRST